MIHSFTTSVRCTLGALVSLAALTGCSACLSPFDYCSPVMSPEGCQNCDFGARRGSMFHPQDGTPPTTPFTPTPFKPFAPTTTTGSDAADSSEAATAEVDADGAVR